MKTISIVIPCYNEEANIHQLYLELKALFCERLQRYKYEILYVDNKSNDNSREIIRKICAVDSNVKAILNHVNCGPDTNSFFALREATGDCAILLYADFQEPIEEIPIMVEKWEEGNNVVTMIKNRSEENKIIYLARELYYKLLVSNSRGEQIRQFTGFGLYDASFLDILRGINDPVPFTKGIISEYASDRCELSYTQRLRRGGKSYVNYKVYYNSAMLSFTTYTKCGIPVILSGGGVMVLGAIIMLLFRIKSIFEGGNIDELIIFLILFIGGIQMLFCGIIGEYVVSINKRIINRPMVIEDERINF